MATRRHHRTFLSTSRTVLALTIALVAFKNVSLLRDGVIADSIDRSFHATKLDGYRRLSSRLRRNQDTDTVSTTAYQHSNKLQRNAPVSVAHEGIQPATSTWHNDNDIVHVIHTRFMQHQPDLLALGTARLKLFQTFCLPTVRGQTSQQFLWIIRVDPDLHPILRHELLDLIDDMSNAAVVASNEIRRGSYDGGFRGANTVADINTTSLWYGDPDLIRSYHAAAATRTVMETNLDADDGLALDFVERTESETIHLKTDEDAWFVWCVDDHIEWQYYAQWDASIQRGSLRPGSSHVCITPGLTWVSMPASEPRFVSSHHHIKRLTPDCELGQQRHGCWMHVPTGNDPTADKKETYTAIRARTPTSTGMNRVVLVAGSRDEFDVEMDEYLWTKLDDFAILPSSITAARRQLQRNLTDIVAENLQGQCTEQHSCSEGIKRKLRGMLQ